MTLRSIVAASFGFAGAVALAAVASATPNDNPPVHEPTNSAVISNGTVKLGVRDEGHLNIVGAGIASRGPDSTTDVGLRLVFADGTESEATAPGCLCEGWGVSANGVAGWATVDNDALSVPGTVSFESFDATASSAVSVVTVGGLVRVTHDYHPSANTPFLYEVTVSVENISDQPVTSLKYRRVMDWDISPTTFSELVTIDSGTAIDLAFVTTNGFDTPNPEAPANLAGFLLGDQLDAGPADHGALFHFEFADISDATPLLPGATREFNTFYGAAFNEDDAILALAAVSAEAFSFGQPSSSALEGVPNTFIFAFGGIGGGAIFDDDHPPVCSITPVTGGFAGIATDDAPSEDSNGNNLLDPGEDLDGDGAIGNDTGIFALVLDGALNMGFDPDAFAPGASSVEFSASPTDSSKISVGTVIATDGSGKSCEENLSSGSFSADGSIVRATSRTLRLPISRPTSSTDAVRCVQTENPGAPDFAGIDFTPFSGDTAEVEVLLTGPVGLKTVCCEFRDVSGALSAPFCEDVEFTEGNRPPLADAGPDQTAECSSLQGAIVTLDGSGSSDPDPGDVLAFSWSDSFGTANGMTPSVSLALGEHEITLLVQDDKMASATDTAHVSVVDTVAPSGQIRFEKVLDASRKRVLGFIVHASCSDTCDASPAAVGRFGGSRAVSEGTFISQSELQRHFAMQKGKVDTKVLSLTCTDDSGNTRSVVGSL